MAISFEKWLDLQLKNKGRAAIDQVTINQYSGFDPLPMWNDQLKELKINWPEWKKKISDNFNRTKGLTKVKRITPEGSEVKIKQWNQEEFIEFELQNVFYSESAVISAYFREYYGMFGIYDRSYFKRLVDDFRRHFSPGNRHPEVTYFDDLICDLMAQYEEKHSGEVPYNFVYYLKAKEREALAEKIKKELHGRKTLDYAALFIALIKTNQIKHSRKRKAIYSAMIEYFGNFGNYQGFMAYLNEGSEKKERSEKNANLAGSGQIDYYSKWLLQQVD